MTRHRLYLCATIGLWFLVLSLSVSALIARQQSQTATQPPAGEALERKNARPALSPADEEKKRRDVKAAIDKMFEAYDLKPHGLPAIPDNPPPHEGAMINYPETIEPPDLVLVELLEGLPGRPISGERLVRPDGMLPLGFYGEVHVAGLTVEQAKVKIIKHLRMSLGDDILGLMAFEPDLDGIIPASPERPKTYREAPIPPLPSDFKPFQPDEERSPKGQATKPIKDPSDCIVRAASQVHYPRSYSYSSRPGEQIMLLARREWQDEKQPEGRQRRVTVPVDEGHQVTITLELQARHEKVADREQEQDGQNIGPPVSPEKSKRVFVDISAHNSKTYYVQGDVAAPGRLPFTGNETVLDALVFAGGLLPTAEPKEIHLVRPARGGKPAKVYTVDLDAIRDKGDITTNYQIFPGDRLVVGRNEVVKKTIQLDRLNAAVQDVFNSLLQESFVLRSFQNLSPDRPDAILKSLVEFWIQELNRPEGAKFDEQTLRDVLIRRPK